MNNFRLLPALAVLALALSACSKEPSNDDVAMTVHEAMTEHVDVIADEVWAIGNESIADNALIDNALMDDAKWAKLADAATRLQGAATDLGGFEHYVVNRPGVTISDEDVPGGTTSEVVQKHINSNTDDFRGMAHALAAHAGDIAAAAKAHDGAQAGKLIGQLDGVCESCHLEFWYPQQRELVEAAMKNT